jgi:hypothetical protein
MGPKFLVIKKNMALYYFMPMKYSFALPLDGLFKFKSYFQISSLPSLSRLVGVHLARTVTSFGS